MNVHMVKANDFCVAYMISRISPCCSNLLPTLLTFTFDPIPFLDLNLKITGNRLSVACDRLCLSCQFVINICDTGALL